MRKRVWQVGFTANCRDCEWATEDYINGNRDAAQHARKNGHVVMAEKTLHIEYGGSYGES